MLNKNWQVKLLILSLKKLAVELIILLLSKFGLEKNSNDSWHYWYFSVSTLDEKLTAFMHCTPFTKIASSREMVRILFNFY